MESLGTEATENVELVIASRDKDLGGLVVRRVLPWVRRRSVGPFVFLDHFGPKRVDGSGAMNVRPHPHIGLETLTYLYEGEILHRDSLGFEQPITPGAVNLMTAGRGIVHSERLRPEFAASGGVLHGLQFWLALPQELEEIEPNFSHFPESTFPETSLPGVMIRVLLGAAFGLVSPAQAHAAALLVDLHFASEAALRLEADERERALYVVMGALEVDGLRHDVGSLLVLRPGHAVTLVAKSEARVALLGGEPLDAPRHMFWNFVSSRPERIESAKRDWEEGRFALVPGDEDERAPLPPG